MVLFGLRSGPGSLSDRFRRADLMVRESSLLVRGLAGLGVFWNVVIVAVVASVVFGGLIGSVQARLQTDYLVSDDSPPRAVIAIYGDTVILANVDLAKHAVNTDFTIVKIGAGPLRVHRATLGQLAPR